MGVQNVLKSAHLTGLEHILNLRSNILACAYSLALSRDISVIMEIICEDVAKVLDFLAYRKTTAR